MFHVKHSTVKGRGAQSGAVPTRFGLAEREVDGDWRDHVQTLDGPPIKLRTTVTEERPRSILTFNQSGRILIADDGQEGDPTGLLPRDVTLESPEGLLAAVRAVARGPLAAVVDFELTYSVPPRTTVAPV